MYTLFGWGKNVGKEGLKYVVTTFTVSLPCSGEHFDNAGNLEAGAISVDIRIPASQKSKPVLDILEFAQTQQDNWVEKGGGKIVVYAGEGVGQPIQEVEFDQAWISSISSVVSEQDKEFKLHLEIKTAKIKISDTDFENKNIKKEAEA